MLSFAPGEGPKAAHEEDADSLCSSGWIRGWSPRSLDGRWNKIDMERKCTCVPKMCQNASKCTKCINMHQNASNINQDLPETRYRERNSRRSSSKSLSAAHVAKTCSGSGWVQGDHDQPRYQATPILLSVLPLDSISIRNQDKSGLSHTFYSNSDFAQDVAGCTRASNSRPRCSLEALGWWRCRTNGWLLMFNLVPWIHGYVCMRWLVLECLASCMDVVDTICRICR